MKRISALLTIFGGALLAVAGTPSIVKVDIGVGLSDKYEAVKPGQVFPNDTPQLFCVWTADAGQGTEIRGVWIAEDVGKIAGPNHKIMEVSEKMPFSKVGNFSLTKPNNGWPVGKYRVDIYIGGKLVKAVPFAIKAK